MVVNVQSWSKWTAAVDVPYLTRRCLRLSVVRRRPSDAHRQSASVTWPTLVCSGSSLWRRSAAHVSSSWRSPLRCSCAESAATLEHTVIIGVILIIRISRGNVDCTSRWRHDIVASLATVAVDRHRRCLSCRSPTSNSWTIYRAQRAAMPLKSRQLHVHWHRYDTNETGQVTVAAPCSNNIQDPCPVLNCAAEVFFK